MTTPDGRARVSDSPTRPDSGSLAGAPVEHGADGREKDGMRACLGEFYPHLSTAFGCPVCNSSVVASFSSPSDT